MASKRKSTVPCMIPSKSKHLREEIILGCLPELLPTIPEDGILSISGQEEEALRTPTTSNTPCCQRGTHSCPPCNFETTDLNLFLNHMDSCHMDFRTQPIFYCLNCKVSLAKFEGLALHNAKTHPELHAEGSPGKAFLQVTQRDGAVRVEQTLFTKREDSGESAISITKTPIMKMMVKGEHKKIIVSHTVEVQRADPSPDKLIVEVNGNASRNLPLATAQQILTGTGPVPVPVLKMPSAHSIPVTQSNLRPLWNSAPPSPDPIHELPKVMIPLSSIPTYDPAMDSSSFLKTSFGKFPYPTKAELCYLTVVSGFPEEQIKLWFTAQRLKQGISWSPEEIEDTRRKMFNTVFHPAPKVRRQSLHQQLPQHCVSVQPTSASIAYTPLTPKVNVTGWKGGVIVAQPGTIQASSLKHQSVVRAPMVAVRQGIITKETGNGLSLQKVESGSASRANVVGNHRPGENFLEIGSSSSGTGGSSAANKKQSYSEASIVNLTNIVRKIDCNVNSRNTDCTSRPSTSSASTCGQEEADSGTKESDDVANTSSKSNNDIYKSTSHSTICTKKEGDMSDHTSKARNSSDSRVICSSTGAGEFLPILTHSLGSHTGSLLDPFLSKPKSKLPNHLEAFKRDLFQNPFPEQTKLMTARDVPLWEVNNTSFHNISTESQVTGGPFFGSISSTSFGLDDAHLQETYNQSGGSSKPLQLEKLSPKVLLGVPQVPSSDFTAIHYKNQDPPALEEHPQPSKIILDTSHFSNTSKERHTEQQEKSKTINTFFSGDTEEESKIVDMRHSLKKKNATNMDVITNVSPLQHYVEEEERWDGGNSCHEPKTEPMKIDSKTLNEEQLKSKANRKLKSMQQLAEDDGSSYENGPSKRHQTHQHTPANKHFFHGDKSITKKSLRQEDQTNCRELKSEQAKHEYLNSERQSVFQSLDTQIPVLVKMSSEGKEETSPVISEKSPAKDHWLIKDEECQDNQSRDCVRGELLKV